MIEGFVKVSKDEAKKLIDAAPGDVIYIAMINRNSFLHKENKKRNKNYGKALIDIAGEVGYQNNEVFGVISLDGIRNVNPNWIHNILFPKLYRTE